MEFLLHTKVSELVHGKRPLVEVEEDATLQQVIHLLEKHRILAVPVCERSAGDVDASKVVSPQAGWGGPKEPGTGRVYGSKKRYSGTVSVVDILLHIAERSLVQEQAAGASLPKLSEPEGGWGPGNQQQPVTPLLAKWVPIPLDSNILETPVSKIVGKSEESRQLLVTDPHTPLYQAMGYLSMGFHRMLVPNFCEGEHVPEDEGRTSFIAIAQPSIDVVSLQDEHRMLTQMDVVRFLMKQEARLGLCISKTLDDLGLVWPGVLSVPTNATMISALLAMRDHQVSAVAVVERHRVPSTSSMVDKIDSEASPHKVAKVATDFVSGGKLVGTLSASDLRSCDPELIWRLPTLTVLEFLDEATLPSTSVPKWSPDQITARRTSTLRSTMMRALEANVHRVWITTDEPDYILEGVVTLTDMIRAVRTAAVAEAVDPLNGVTENATESGPWLDWWMGERLPLDRVTSAKPPEIYPGKLL